MVAVGVEPTTSTLQERCALPLLSYVATLLFNSYNNCAMQKNIFLSFVLINLAGVLGELCYGSNGISNHKMRKKILLVDNQVESEGGEN